MSINTKIRSKVAVKLNHWFIMSEL